VYLEPPHCLAADVEKLADPAPGVQAQDALLLPPAGWAQPVEAAPYIPDEVPFVERSFAVTAHAVAQPEPLISLLLEPAAVAARLAMGVPLKAEAEPEPQPLEAPQPAESADAQELKSLAAWQPTQAAARLAAREQ